MNLGEVKVVRLWFSRRSLSQMKEWRLRDRKKPASHMLFGEFREWKIPPFSPMVQTTFTE
jgi:hypothetical protein